jgi:hypothetical protein
MEGTANPFAQAPTTPEPIIAQVRRDLERDLGGDLAIDVGLVDRVAERSDRDLWSSRVKTFLPVLALRDARETLRDHGIDVVATRPPEPSAAGVSLSQQVSPWDVLALDDRDALSVGEDVLSM